MSKKVPLYKKEGDVFVKVGEIAVDDVLRDMEAEGVEEIEAAYVFEEEEELPEEEEEKRVYEFKPE